MWNIRTGKATVFDTPKGATTVPALQGLGPAEAINANGWIIATGYVLRDGDPIVLTVPKGQRPVAAALSDTGLVAGQIMTGDPAAGPVSTSPRTWQC